MKLISHVNGDSDLIEAWMKYYMRLGVDDFHFVVHGPREENSTLYAVKDLYPITIEDSYEGSFHIEEKRKRLDSVLARCPGQWVLLADSDEFVEFPYATVQETISELEAVGANVMAAPMLQRLAADGSLETPLEILDPFRQFPLCLVDLYRRMGVKGDIFKFPLFRCTTSTRLAEGGNHHPPKGEGPRATAARGVTHHFKFRRTVSRRLDSRINSDHPWRHESAQFRQYLEDHGNRLPRESSFAYSREELFRRGLLRMLPLPATAAAATATEAASKSAPNDGAGSKLFLSVPRSSGAPSTPIPSRARKKIVFVVPKTTEFGGLERHLLAVLDGLRGTEMQSSILCIEHETLSQYIDRSDLGETAVRCVLEPHSVGQWYSLFRQFQPHTIVFCYSWINAFSWRSALAAWLASKKCFSIQHLIPPPAPPFVEGSSPWIALKRRIGRRARYMLKVNLIGRLSQTTICVCDAVRDSLVTNYEFPARTTITVHNGVSTTTFVPGEPAGYAVRSRFEISPDEFLLVCAARLSEAKGVDILLHAVSRVLRQGISLKCIILGDGPLKADLIGEANRLGLTGYVFFEGFQRDVRPYFQAASAFILTSHLEGLPLSILEAMACGQPCIVTNVGGNAEVVKDRVNGLVIAPGSFDEAEEAILFLATHPEERAAMAHAARESVLRSFEIKDRIHELTAVILQSKSQDAQAATAV
jgi:glycosyltransferase involved in cell wall biosynthesis